MFDAKRFRTVVATTPQELIQIYELRHLVYCALRGLEPTRSTSQETDELDPLSKHIGVWDRQTGVLCGTARIIPAGVTLPLPFSTVAACHMPASVAGFGELSRFTIHPDYATMKFEGQALFSAVSVNILRGAAIVSRNLLLDRWGMLIEKRFHRGLRMLGFSFQTEGDPVEFHGIRKPCIFSLDTGFRGLMRKCPQAWRFLHPAF